MQRQLDNNSNLESSEYESAELEGEESTVNQPIVKFGKPITTKIPADLTVGELKYIYHKEVVDEPIKHIKVIFRGSELTDDQIIPRPSAEEQFYLLIGTPVTPRRRKANPAGMFSDSCNEIKKQQPKREREEVEPEEVVSTRRSERLKRRTALIANSRFKEQARMEAEQSENNKKRPRKKQKLSSSNDAVVFDAKSRLGNKRD